MPTSLKPYKLTVHMYQVGCGDCFLLQFHYDKDDGDDDACRFVMIDFGGDGHPTQLASISYPTIAKDIAKKVKESPLDAVVVTHRHKDHIRGFADKAAVKALASLKPRYLLQPWTEESPDITQRRGLRTRDAKRWFAYKDSLQASRTFLKAVPGELYRLRRVLGESAARSLRVSAEIGAPTANAIRGIYDLKANDTNVLYLHSDCSLPKDLLPGVEISVLGPPTTQQFKDLWQDAPEGDPNLWNLLAPTQRLTRPGAVSLRGRTLKVYPPYARRFVATAQNARAEELLGIITNLGSVCNNTSLILTFRVGRKVVLFPGDAEVQTWGYVLGQTKWQSLLKKTVFYKVGHHGSRNATPKKMLWEDILARPSASARQAAVSTLAKVHVSPTPGHSIPNETLIGELKKRLTLTDSRDFKPGLLSQPIEVQF